MILDLSKKDRSSSVLQVGRTATESTREYNVGCSDGAANRSRAVYARYQGPTSPYNSGYFNGKKSRDAVSLQIKQHNVLMNTLRAMGLPVDKSTLDLARALS